MFKKLGQGLAGVLTAGFPSNAGCLERAHALGQNHLGALCVCVCGGEGVEGSTFTDVPQISHW